MNCCSPREDPARALCPCAFSSFVCSPPFLPPSLPVAIKRIITVSQPLGGNDVIQNAWPPRPSTHPIPHLNNHNLNSRTSLPEWVGSHFIALLHSKKKAHTPSHHSPPPIGSVQKPNPTRQASKLTFSVVRVRRHATALFHSLQSWFQEPYATTPLPFPPATFAPVTRRAAM